MTEKITITLTPVKYEKEHVTAATRRGKQTERRQTMNEPKFSFFKAPVTNKVPTREVTITQMFDYILGFEAQERTRQLRSLSDPDEVRKFKATQFDYVCFSGTFSYGSDSGLLQHSGLICLDFDHVKELNRVKSQLIADPHFTTQLLFVSPSGDGLKWVISTDLRLCDHRTWFCAMSNYVRATYGIQADEKCINVSRACFLPHDPLVYVNPNLCNY